MTIPDERIRELRRMAEAVGVNGVADPGELTRRSIRAHLASTGGLLPPDRPEVAIRLFGPGIQGHEVAVRDAAAILLSVQETIASIGQALRHDPTLHGAIQAQIQAATELRLTSELGSGSVVFRLLGVGEGITGDEAAELVGSDTLVDAAMDRLLALVDESTRTGPDSGQLAQTLRRLGPRTAKHIAELAKQVIKDQIEVDLAWRNPSGRWRQASLQRDAAQALTRAIELNRVETQTIEMTGVLDTISTARKPELRTEEGRIRLSVDRDLARELGPFFDQEVTATVERTITWSTNTGKETRNFRLLRVRNANEP